MPTCCVLSEMDEIQCMFRQDSIEMARTVARVAAVLFLACIVSGCSKSNECTPDLIDNCSYIMVYDPVCGCDGNTYSNSGEAACHSIYEYTGGACN